MSHFRPRYGKSRGHRPTSTFQPQSAPRAYAPPPPPPPATPSPATGAELAAIQASPFTALGLEPRLVRALLSEGYTEPTPIQSQVIAHLLQGRDVLGCAQTGTGKTAAFVLPILQQLSTAISPRIRAVVLTPTRELAAQIAERLHAYGRHVSLRYTTVFGGVSQHGQEIALRRGVDILVATPGRLLDLMGQRLVDLGGVTHLVLDEADRMLDMGFIHDVRKIVQTIPREGRQTLLFSATMPRSVQDLANSMLTNPVRVAVTPAVTTAEGVEQTVMFVGREQKRAALIRLLSGDGIERALVFTRTKHGANRLSEQLDKSGIGSEAIHGNKSQNQRTRALEAFRRGTTRVLVATDVASRGIDVDGISHVINFDLPMEPESYVHRIGRTGRAGAMGKAISFCGPEERGLLNDIERFIRKRLPVTALAV